MSVSLPVNGFWSYARLAGALDGPIREGMQRTLKMKFVAVADFRMQLDVDPETGVKHGAHWERALIENIAQSFFFFWVQTPAWFTRPVCRFEFDLFEANLKRVEFFLRDGGISIDEATLRRLMLNPIRLEKMGRFEWELLPDAVRDRYYEPWYTTNVRDEFNYSTTSALGSDAEWRYRAAADHIYEDTKEVLSGEAMKALFRFLALPDPVFLNAWLPRAPRSATLDDNRPSTCDPTIVAAQGRLAARATKGIVSRTVPGMKFLEVFLAPFDSDGRSGFWATTAPIGGPFADGIKDHLPPEFAPKRLPLGGHLGWTIEAAIEVERILAGHGLSLPTAQQAAALAALADQGDELCGQLRWRQRIGAFWQSDGEGRVRPSAGSATRLPILLTMPISEGRA